MPPRSTQTGLIALGVVASQVTLASEAGKPASPEWIKITPRGQVQTRDGRGLKLNFDPEMLASRQAADGVHVAVDLDHAIAIRTPKGDSVDPIGYATALSAREDGTYAKVDWLAAGDAVFQRRTHRYVSPSVYHAKESDAAGFHDVTGLHSISLVSAPALSMQALLSALGHDDNPEPSMKQIAKALGLAEDANEAACLAAINGRVNPKTLAKALKLPETTTSEVCLAAIGLYANTEDFAKALGLDEKADAKACLAAIGTLKGGAGDNNTLVTSLQAQLKTTTDRLTTVEKAARDKDVAELLEGGLKDRKIVPAQRAHLAALCATDDGLKEVRAMLGATAPGLQDSVLDRRAPGSDGELDPKTLAAAATKLQAERDAAGQPIGYAEAVALVADKKA